jgi:RNA polymerase sigma-70 factor (ECF subfamily)
VRELDATRLGDHIDALYRAAWALCGSSQDAEDLVQETYVRVLARPRLLRRDDDLGYLLRVLRNTFLSDWRAKRRRPRSAPLEDAPEPSEARPSLQPDAALDAKAVYEAIARLPEAFRDAVVAVDLVGLSYREAANALSTREGTIMSRLSRGREQVARALGG